MPHIFSSIFSIHFEQSEGFTLASIALSTESENRLPDAPTTKLVKAPHPVRNVIAKIMYSRITLLTWLFQLQSTPLVRQAKLSLCMPHANVC